MPPENDLYNSLLAESKLYREKVSTIWLQKFTMLGGIIAFAATRAESTTHSNSGLVVAAILALPVIAILLDVKLGEFGIHARVIDDFIIENFPDPPILSRWERTKWGAVPTHERTLVRYRSIATVAVTIIPTCIVMVLSVLAVKTYVGFSFYYYLRIAAVCFCVIYVVLGILSGPIVLFRHIRLARKQPAS